MRDDHDVDVIRSDPRVPQLILEPPTGPPERVLVWTKPRVHQHDLPARAHEQAVVRSQNATIGLQPLAERCIAFSTSPARDLLPRFWAR